MRLNEPEQVTQIFREHLGASIDPQAFRESLPEPIEGHRRPKEKHHRIRSRFSKCRVLFFFVFRFFFFFFTDSSCFSVLIRSTGSTTGSLGFAAYLTIAAAFTDHDDLGRSLRVLWYVLASRTGLSPAFEQPADGVCTRAAGAQRRPVRHPGDRRLHDHQPRPVWKAHVAAGLVPGKRGGAVPRRVDYAALDVEELGSVYESLPGTPPGRGLSTTPGGPASVSMRPASSVSGPAKEPPAPITRRPSWWAS